jgi:hypothetical protein
VEVLEVLLQGGNAQLPNSLIIVVMLLDYCLVLVVIVLALVML